MVMHKRRLGLVDFVVVITQPLVQRRWSFAFLAASHTSRNPNENPSEGFEFVLVPPRNLAIKTLLVQQFHGHEGQCPSSFEALTIRISVARFHNGR
jgi:hypothetical protein